MGLSKQARNLEVRRTVVATCGLIGLPEPVIEYRFHPVRRWLFDWAWPDRKVALEYEGGTWTGGAHTRGKHFDSDTEKYNEAWLAGWGVLRFTATHLKSGIWMGWLERALRPYAKGEPDGVSKRGRKNLPAAGLVRAGDVSATGPAVHLGSD
jgi:hypothetical protein